MIGRMIGAYRVELIKAVRHWTSYIGPFLVLVSVTAAFLIRPVARDGESDYAFIAFATPMALNLLGFLMILFFACNLVSSELSSGTLRTMLLQPIRRREVLFGKLMLTLTYILAIDLLAAASIWTGTALLGDLGGVRYGGEMLYTDREMAGTFVLATALTFAPQCASAAYGILFSTLTRSSTAATASAIGVWLILETVKYPLRIESFVFFSFLEWPWQVFADRCDAIAAEWLPTAQQALAVSALSTVVLFFAASFALARWDISR